MSPVSTEDSPITLMAEEITEMHHDVKIPHGTQTPFRLMAKAFNEWGRVCR